MWPFKKKPHLNGDALKEVMTQITLVEARKMVDDAIVESRKAFGECDTCHGVFRKNGLYEGKPEVRIKYEYSNGVYWSGPGYPTEYVYHPAYCAAHRPEDKKARK